MARRTKLTTKTISDICDALSQGASYRLAAAYARISFTTFGNWLRFGRAAQEKQEQGLDLTVTERRYLSFLIQAEDAMADAAIEWQQVIARAARTDPSWAKFMLEKRFPEPQQQQMLLNLNIDYAKLSDEQLQRIAAGESPLDVLANSGAGGTGTAPPPDWRDAED